MTARGARLQRGVALLALLAVIALAASWYLVKQLNAESGGLDAARKNRNAEVLNRAKQALIGYIAMQAAQSGENNPGALPCPEAAAYYGDLSQEGRASPNCALPKVGRFPWRTLGLDKLVDSTGEPLWYAVGPGWAYTSGSNTTINSNSIGQLTVNGIANDAVALIIAPGPAFSVAAATGCAAWNQTRPTTGTLDWRNYLECENATNPADSAFVTTGPSGSFNDQVMRITAADILPAIEAAVAQRIEREIAPLMRTMYNGGSWSTVTTSVLPFAAAFADPSSSTTTFKGVTGNYQGLLPLVYSETTPLSGTACTPGVTAPRCDPTFVAWTSATMSGPDIYSPSCTVTAAQITCTYHYRCALLGCAAATLSFTLQAEAANVGMALRRLNSAAAMTNVSAVTGLSGALNSTGSASVTLNASTTAPASGLFTSLLNAVCDILLPLSLTVGCLQSSISVPIALLADHEILDSTSTGANVGWFLRNKWHEVAYYVVAPDIAPSGAHSCITGTTCLSVTNHRNSAGVIDAGAQRGIIVLSGRTLTNATRPNATLSDWLEGANTTADGSNANPFQVRSPSLAINRAFNDRIVVLDSNP